MSLSLGSKVPGEWFNLRFLSVVSLVSSTMPGTGEMLANHELRLLLLSLCGLFTTVVTLGVRMWSLLNNKELGFEEEKPWPLS